MLEESVPRILALLREAGRLAQHEWLERGRDLLGSAAWRVESVSAGGAGISLSKEGLGGLLALREALPPGRWTRPIIVAIDEAPNLPPDRNSPTGILLRGIHGGETGLPLTLVLAGLGETADQANDLGLTRGRRIHEIGALKPRDASYFMMESCRNFGMDPGPWGERLDALVRPCEGWPRHLHFALQALGQVALETDGDLSRVDWQLIEREADESRIRYYLGQQSRQMERSAGLVVGVMLSLNTRSRISSVMKSMKPNDREAGWQLPKGMDAGDFLDHLIHQGALHRHEDKTITCPIPSFRTFLMEAGGLETEAKPPSSYS